MSSIPSVIQTASAIQATQVQSQVQTALAKKQLDVAKQQGAAAIKLIQHASNIGKQLDVRV